MINDVRALRAPQALEAAAAGELGICLMHMQGEPADMQLDPRYGDVVAEVRAYLSERLRACRCRHRGRAALRGPGIRLRQAHGAQSAAAAGIAGSGVSRTAAVVGLSRKSLVAALTGRPLAERLAGSLALATVAVLKGARIVRAHDVAATVERYASPT